MLAIRITGSQLRAGRALAGLSIEDLAARAPLCRRPSPSGRAPATRCRTRWSLT